MILLDDIPAATFTNALMAANTLISGGLLLVAIKAGRLFGQMETKMLTITERLGELSRWFEEIEKRVGHLEGRQ